MTPSSVERWLHAAPATADGSAATWGPSSSATLLRDDLGVSPCAAGTGYPRAVTPLLPALAAALLATGDGEPIPADPAPPQPMAAAAVPDWTVPAAHTGALFLGMRVTLSLAWPDAYDPTDWDAQREQLRLSFTRPPELDRHRPLLESDGDPWWLNGVGHALLGSELYGRTRQCGAGPGAALLATAAASAAWEYVVESPHQRPSAIDLVWTPLAGALLGEGRFRLQRWLRARDPRTWLLFVVDPLGELERRAFGTGC